MPAYGYAFQKDAGETARAVGRSLPISDKVGLEMCSRIRYQSVAAARRLLEDAIAMRRPIKFTRFTNGLGHKPGMGPGRYHPTAARYVLATVNSAVKNAEVKNLGADLVIIHACAQRASRAIRYGRQSRVREKRVHIEIVVAPKTDEGKKAVDEKKSKKATSPKSAPKQKTAAAHKNAQP